MTRDLQSKIALAPIQYPIIFQALVNQDDADIT